MSIYIMLETFDKNLTFLNNWRYIAYDPSVSPEDDASKESPSEKYSKMLSYIEAVGFAHEVCKVKIGDIDQTVPRGCHCL